VNATTQSAAARQRVAPLDMDAEEFRLLGHRLVDRLADFLTDLPTRPVSPGESPAVVRAALGNGSLPDEETAAGQLLDEATTLLLDHSTFNGHPRFWGYVTSSPAPIGALGDLLAAVVNPNVGAWGLAPIATEIEAQTVRWIAELLGYPASCGGLLVSGGTMANFVGLLAARHARAGWDVRNTGLAANPHGTLRIYGSAESHTWLQKAADIFGFGAAAVRLIPTDADLRLDIGALRNAIETDEAVGDRPFLVVGTAGTVSTGAVDPLPEIAAVCRGHGLWFHVDGAYGGFAAALPDASPDLRGLREADSVAVDPHKWLYTPLEAGCVLVNDPTALVAAFGHRPAYYHFDVADDARINFYEHGPQNSRGFRALKVWLGLRQAGRAGCIAMMADDIALARELHRRLVVDQRFEARTQALSITTFRYVPPELSPGDPDTEAYLTRLNTEVLNRLQLGGAVYLSNAVVDGTFLLRVCVVNFRTTDADIAALPDIVARIGAEVDAAIRPPDLTGRG